MGTFCFSVLVIANLVVLLWIVCQIRLFKNEYERSREKPTSKSEEDMRRMLDVCTRTYSLLTEGKIAVYMPREMRNMLGVCSEKLSLLTEEHLTSYMSRALETLHQKKPTTLAFTELKIPTSKELMGALFEEWVLNKFVFEYIELLEWRSDKKGTMQGNAVFPKTSEYPDFVLRYKGNDYPGDTRIRKFAVECKYHSYEYASLFVDDDKIERYRNYMKDHSTPVFVVIGRGGVPYAPKEVYIVKLSNECDINETGGDLSSCICKDLSKGFNYKTNNDIEQCTLDLTWRF